MSAFACDGFVNTAMLVIMALLMHTFSIIAMILCGVLCFNDGMGAAALLQSGTNEKKSVFVIV